MATHQNSEPNSGQLDPFPDSQLEIFSAMPNVVKDVWIFETQP
jgi:hypothetical protein